MTKITRQNASEYEPYHFVAEASTLGLAPGKWPNGLDTDLGNGQRFVLIVLDEEGARYTQQFGCIFLQVLND